MVLQQQPIKTMPVLKKMGMDLIGLLPKSKQGHVYALVMQDYFTKWLKAIPLKDSTAKSVAGVLLSVILVWGPPVELFSNQGPEFMAELNCKLLRQWGIKRQYAMAYTPKLMDRLSGSTGCSTEWQAGQLGHLPASLTLHIQDEPLGHTPYKPMLGRAPPSEDGAATESIPMDEWVQELLIAQEEARKLISANIKSEQKD